MRTWAGVSVAPGLGVSLMLWAQSSVTTVPFASTPLVTGWDGTAETIFVRQPGTGAYDQLRFGGFQPFGLASSAASLAQIVTGSVKFSMNTPAGPAGVGRAPQFFALADFTGDGSPGIAMAEPVGYNDDSLTIDEFTPSFLYRTGKKYQYGQGNAAGVHAADFNGDGKPDLAVAYDSNAGDGSVLIYLNSGDGTFANPVYYPAGSEPASMATLDVNGDGVLALVVASEDFSVGTVSIFCWANATELLPPGITPATPSRLRHHRGLQWRRGPGPKPVHLTIQ